MAYYNELGNKTPIPKEEMKVVSKEGNFSTIYRIRNVAFKEYLKETPQRYRLSLMMFRLLKTIRHSHFMELYSLYTELSPFAHITSKYKKDTFLTTAYTKTYYLDNTVNAMYESIDYLMDNVRALEDLFSLFTEEGIVADDVKRDNAILGKEGMVLIDPDTYFLSTMAKEKIAIQNKRNLLHFIRSVCISGLKEHPCFKEWEPKIFEDLTFFRYEEYNANMDVTSKIYQKLKGVKRPIDYLEKK